MNLFIFFFADVEWGGSTRITPPDLTLNKSITLKYQGNIYVFP